MALVREMLVRLTHRALASSQDDLGAETMAAAAGPVPVPAATEPQAAAAAPMPHGEERSGRAQGARPTVLPDQAAGKASSASAVPPPGGPLPDGLALQEARARKSMLEMRPSLMQPQSRSRSIACLHAVAQARGLDGRAELGIQASGTAQHIIA